jgi:DNA-binding response OmpR family regulator
MTEVRILIVEDESIVAMEIASYVEKLGYTVAAVCSNAEDALKLTSEQKVDIVIMDICIKGDKDGIETAALIKKEHMQTEIIFLTAHLDDYNVDRAIDIDPTAYLSKPFNREELKIFLKIALCRLEKKIGQCEETMHHLILDHEFSYDLETHTLYCCQEIINLTKKENDLLALFIQNKNKLIELYTIEHTIWPDKVTNTNTLRTLVKRLRQKLKHKFIETVPAQGYRFRISAN